MRSFAYYSLLAFAFVASAHAAGVEVESAVARTHARAHARNPAIMAGLNDVLGPPSLTLPSGYDKMVRPYRNERILNVSVGLKVKRIAEVNDKDGSVVFDMIILTQWRDPRLKGIAFKRILPKDVWTPGLFVSNEGKEPEWFSSEMVLDKAGYIIYERRVLVTVEHPFELLHFPFDHHAIKVTVNAFGYDANELLLRADKNMTTDGLSDSTWDLETFIVRDDVRKTMLSPRDSVVEGTLYVKRKTLMMGASIIMPLILIVLFTFLSFFVWERDFGSRITITSIGFLTVMAFMFVVNDQLPRIAYLTWLHYYMSLCFLMTFFVNVHVTMVHFLNPIGETKLEKKKRLMKGGAAPVDTPDEKDNADVEDPLLSPEQKMAAEKELRRDRLVKAMEEVETKEDSNLTAEEIVEVSKNAGFPVSKAKAKKWIAQSQVFQGQKHLSFETFLKLMEEKIESDGSKKSLLYSVTHFDPIKQLGYTKDNIANIDKSCRWWLPFLFFVISVIMFALEAQNMSYSYKATLKSKQK